MGAEGYVVDLADEAVGHSPLTVATTRRHSVLPQDVRPRQRCKARQGPVDRVGDITTAFVERGWSDDEDQ
jgi:hypothetical protein